MIKTDEFWMSKCLNLAKLGTGTVSPNPLVGAVIVKNGKQISEGYHQRYGGQHAEINAIRKALLNKKTLSGTTLYVNLEPCFHFGKTPPCVDAILKQRISRVVVATQDPNPLVAGKSLKKLKKNGIKCTDGVLKNDAERLNEKFFTFIKTGLPFVALKAAQTSDGFIAKLDGTSKWITNKQSRNYVHRLRSEYDAILVGANTVIKDDPELTVRNIKGRNPIRVIIDGKLSVDLNKKVFNAKAPTIVYTTKKYSVSGLKKISALEKQGIVVVQMEGKKEILKIKKVISDLGVHQIASVLVEGGQKVFSEFLNASVVDKLYLFTAKKTFGVGLKIFKNNSKPFTLLKNSEKKFGTDVLEEFYLRQNKINYCK
jgi:diaminohydroxyphosphoribosylaminopyrimidine deaminase/5-amino-6-(5-phosphoribosylamino)uracil reductase